MAGLPCAGQSGAESPVMAGAGCLSWTGHAGQSNRCFSAPPRHGNHRRSFLVAVHVTPVMTISSVPAGTAANILIVCWTTSCMHCCSRNNACHDLSLPCLQLPLACMGTPACVCAPRKARHGVLPHLQPHHQGHCDPLTICTITTTVQTHILYFLLTAALVLMCAPHHVTFREPAVIRKDLLHL